MIVVYLCPSCLDYIHLMWETIISFCSGDYASTYKLLSLFKTCLKIWNVIFKCTRLSACPAVWFRPSCLQPLFRFFNSGDQASADHERNKWVTFNHGALQMHELDVKGKGFRIHLISIIQHGISLFNAFWYIMCFVDIDCFLLTANTVINQLIKCNYDVM